MNDKILAKGTLAKVASGPGQAKFKKLKLKDSAPIFACGLYLVTGSAKSGKSVITRAILEHAARPDSEWTDVAPIYIFEPGAPAYERSSGTGEARFFQRASDFITPEMNGDFPAFLADAGFSAEAKSVDRIGMMVIDSVNEPMRSFDPTGRATQAAAEKGMLPADRAFCSVLNNFAERAGLVLLATVNSQLVPFAELLDGACQGMIRVISTSEFVKHDRASGRIEQHCYVDPQAMKAAMETLGYTGSHTAQRDSFFND